MASSDLVKIYLVDPYTVGKISASSISWYLQKDFNDSAFSLLDSVDHT